MKVRLKKIAIVTYLLAASNAAISSTIPSIEQLEQLYGNQEYREIVKNIGESNVELMSPQQYTIYIYALSKIDLDDAEDAANNALRLFADNPDMYMVHASIMGEQAQNSIFSALSYAEKALNSLLKAVDLNPDSPKYRLGLMGFYLAAPSIAGGDTDLALAQANKIMALDQLKGAVALSRYYYTTDDIDKAISIVNEALITSPNNGMLYNQIASVHVRTENNTDAIAAYRKVINIGLSETHINSSNDDDRQSELYRYYNSHYQVGRLALLSESELVLGIEHLNKYLALKASSLNWDNNLPSSNWALLRLAELYLLNEQVVDARQAYDSAALEKEDDDMKSVYKKLGKKIKKLEKAS